MKRLFTVLAYWILFAAISYLICLMSELKYNPLSWQVYTRFLSIIIFFALSRNEWQSKG